MRRSLLVLAISAISSGAVASGYAIWTYASGDWTDRPAVTAVAPQTSNTKPAPQGSRVAALTPPAALPPGTSALLAIEVARIEAGGPSILAGRSPPNHKVTLLANGREIATVTATDEGQWAAIVPDGIEAGSLELSIVSQPKDGGASVRGASRQLVVPPAAPSLATAQPRTPPARAIAEIERPGAKGQGAAGAQAPTQAKGDEAASKRALVEFEALVERTRKEMAQKPAGAPVKSAAATATAPVQAAAPVATTSAPTPVARTPAPADTRIAAATSPSTTPAPAQAPIPLPITFESNQAALTPDGERAASLLAEYLKLRRPSGIALSGHADARGPDGYNMRLSLRRLEVIERYLRAAGYSGELSLVPRGKREPYQGIDRKRLPRHLIYQADRRVELQLTP